jgi:hypothetical protein
VESIEHPERFPLVSKKGPNPGIQPTRRQKRRRAGP